MKVAPISFAVVVIILDGFHHGSSTKDLAILHSVQKIAIIDDTKSMIFLMLKTFCFEIAKATSQLFRNRCSTLYPHSVGIVECLNDYALGRHSRIV